MLTFRAVLLSGLAVLATSCSLHTVKSDGPAADSAAVVEPSAAPAASPTPPSVATAKSAIAHPSAATRANLATPLALQEIREELPRLRTIDLVTQPDDLWARVRNGFSMPDLMNDQVMDRQAYYLNRPEELVRLFERSRRYLYYIVTELERRGMPTELALLPMVESAFNPMAYSSAHASGLWQFIPATGKSYNLSQNWWFDQRRDIIASTNAALDYLQTIYEMHGDWQLTLASYNWGENAVARAIERNAKQGLPTDYNNLNMPAETRYYVPKLQALKNIISQPQLFGIALPPIANRPYFTTVPKPAGIDVALAAKLAETPIEEFMALNPAYNRPVMPGEASQSIVVPIDKVDIFLSNLQNHDEPLTTWTTYPLRKGETVDTVAARVGITGARLRQVNGIPPGWRVPVGHALLIPAHSPASLELSPADLTASRALLPTAAPVRASGAGAPKRTTAAPATRRVQASARPVRSAAAARGKAVVHGTASRKSGSNVKVADR